MSGVIDIYCERTSPEFWAEPINALTNLCFILAAMGLFLQAHRKNVLHSDISLLIVLIGLIGVGSGLFHTYATRTTMLADVIPILVYQISFLVIFSKTVINLSGMAVFRLVMVYILLTILSGYIPREWFNGSQSYAPALIFVTGFGIYLAKYATQKSSILLVAAGVFLLSLTFRSIDMYVCQDIEIGTHFMWHILNSIVLYLCTYALISQRQPSRRAS